MLPYLILGVGLLVAILGIIRLFVSVEPKALVLAVRWTAIGGAALFAVYLTVTGRLGWALMLLPAVMPWLIQFRHAQRMAKNFQRMRQRMGGGTTGQTSAVETRFINMTLDHDTGRMTGEVREGAHAGRSLDGLSLEALLDLLRTCRREDDASAQVLESYLDRAHEGWRGRPAEEADPSGGASRSAPGGMSREEALAVLGLEPGATTDQIKDAHRRLISNLHPDVGGSTYLAAKINQAKDVLLGGR
ncbi:MAG: molecular chaperone DnaJ [Rhodospirillales bacterium]|nr:molecular chaperone DnaJ [Rhodospirillales bacterium]